MATMQRGVSSFMTQLSDDPDLLVEYMRDRDAVIERACLPSEDRDAIVSGDLQKIRARITAEQTAVNQFPWVMKPDLDEFPVVMKPDLNEFPVIMKAEVNEYPIVMKPDLDELPVIMEPELEA